MAWGRGLSLLWHCWEEKEKKMEWFKQRTYARQRPKNVYCSSPVPRGALSGPRGSRKASTLQPCCHLFQSHAQSVNGNPNRKALPKIKENSEVTKTNSSSDQSDQLNDEKITCMEENEDIREKSTMLLRESLHINSESKESLKNSETTSGLTLPTGVSTFLLHCLDMDSSTESTDSMNSCPSPEIFRDEDSLDRNNSNPEEFLKYKNSTLLDTSKAVTIDKMLQLSNLSEILEAISEGHQDQYVGRESPSKCNKDSSELMNVSTVVAGKQTCKIASTMEKTLDIKRSTFSSLRARPKRQLDNQNANSKNMKCRKKVKFSSLLTSETSSCHQLASPAEPDIEMEMNSKVLIAEKNRQLLTSTAYFQPEELEFNLSPVHKASFDEDLFLNSTGPYVNSEEIAPASLSSEEKIYQSLHNKETQNKKSNTQNKEICSIIKTSPGLKVSMVHRTPVNRNTLHSPEGIPEDVITSTKNWVYSDHG
ncbi:meiosis-specific kinetochore protein isoform X2 [Dermochelys coriacea]|uniref:meiosis-specific kinetochore protein isoform X2 n=1 Tax=Dermochelys coriacea TaxID=27794 RepID=UPI001CA91835|nr:meiosis-specific kinetochore protein isoform X2 [Dermochelys coriacea]